MLSPDPDAESWVEPETGVTYPVSYSGYCRAREAEEKWAARHRCLGPDIDRYVWDRWQRSGPSNADVVLTFRPGTSPRIQRIVGEVVRAIGRGRPAGQAIGQVARRFGLRHRQARAFIATGIGFELRDRPEPVVAHGVWSSSSLFAN